MVKVTAIMLLEEARYNLCFWCRQDIIYNMLLCLIAFLATRYIIAKDLAFSSPLNDPPKGTNGIHEGVANKSHCLLEGQIEVKDFDTDIREVTSLHTQYES